ncbi:MAG: hypothetical protein PWR27_932 [Petroclostridium sp.]|jgi:microcompartment protein CcmL/EutN|uniref:BMC domain-containing protein n=1 Tax=Petroclostridium xylanilyticum TaxID=1792311 RepID=UPI000B98919D|nr:BMC domain-containing protein [Petroclostridium xylanilyticum]MBZ4644544.1 hypothetical protein [Clostridia bacterium]MDK2810223.1 hypothetical protein [Petroclostridium sp.]
MGNQAIGFIEVFGYVTAIKAADAAAKAADVRIVALDSTKPAAGDAAEVPLVMLVKLEGSVSAVQAAVAAGVEAAKRASGVIAHHVIARPDDETQKLVTISNVGKDKLRKVGSKQ